MECARLEADPKAFERGGSGTGIADHASGCPAERRRAVKETDTVRVRIGSGIE